MIKGIATSPGICIGKVFKYEKYNFSIDTNQKADDVDLELNKIDQAVNETIKDISSLKNKAQVNLNEEDAKIFDAHLMMINDPSYIGKIKEKINNGYSALASAKVVSDELINVFNSMESEYFKERVNDFIDVSDRLLYNILGKKVNSLADIKEESIIVTYDLKPSDTLCLDKRFVKGIICEEGSYTSHASIISRFIRIPSIVSSISILDKVDNGTMVIVDGVNGNIILDPSDKEIEEYKLKIKEYEDYNNELKEYANKECVTLDGHKTHISLNICHNDELSNEVFYHSGVGLLRTELIYLEEKNAFPSEDKQFEIYKKVLSSYASEKVVVRTIDIGGDKKLDYFKFDTENNPFLGYRAIRLCLDRKDIFKPQIRALLRSSIYGNLNIMFPMIASVDEFLEAKKFVLDTKEELIKEGFEVADNINIGAMIEVPSSVLVSSALAKYADFFSIGSNDLVQYTMAADRTLKDVSYLYQPLNPSVLKMIKMAIDGAHKYNRFIGMCGEMSSNLEAIPLLLGLGLDDFSMFESNICKCKKLINSLNYEQCKKIALEAIELENEQQVKDLLKKELGI